MFGSVAAVESSVSCLGIFIGGNTVAGPGSPPTLLHFLLVAATNIDERDCALVDTGDLILLSKNFPTPLDSSLNRKIARSNRLKQFLHIILWLSVMDCGSETSNLYKPEISSVLSSNTHRLYPFRAVSPQPTHSSSSTTLAMLYAVTRDWK